MSCDGSGSVLPDPGLNSPLGLNCIFILLYMFDIGSIYKNRIAKKNEQIWHPICDTPQQ